MRFQQPGKSGGVVQIMEVHKDALAAGQSAFVAGKTDAEVTVGLEVAGDERESGSAGVVFLLEADAAVVRVEAEAGKRGEGKVAGRIGFDEGDGGGETRVRRRRPGGRRGAWHRQD